MDTTVMDLLKKTIPKSAFAALDIDDILGGPEIVPLSKLLGYDFFDIQKGWADWALGGFEKKERDEHGKLKVPGEVKMILGARGYGKTESIILYGCTKLLRQNPNLTFAISTRKQTRGKEIVTTLSHIMPKMGFRGRFLFESIVLERQDGTYSKQPTFKIIPVGTTLKGNHCNIMIVDDPLDPADYKSRAWKDRAMKFTQNCQDIADLTIIIGQYVNEDDLYVHYESTLPEANIIRCWHGTIPELDVQWKDKRAQGYTLREWGLNYEGKFYPDDERRLNIKLTDQMPYDTVCYIDMSYIRKSMTSPDGDYTAVAFGQLAGPARRGKAGKVLYPDLVVAGYLFANSNSLKTKIMDLIDKHDCRYIVYDASKDYHEEFVEWLDYSNFRGRVVAARSEKEKKETKIIRNITWLQDTDGLRYWHGSDRAFLDQVEMYTPMEAHDDAPDAVACLIRELRNGRESRRGVLQNATIWASEFNR